MPSEKLFAIGNSKLRMNEPANDTSIVCYTIIYNRYDDNAGTADKRRMIETCMHLWSIYFYTFYDYPKCFEYIAKARDIAQSSGLKYPTIYLSFGAMYQTIAEESHNMPLNRKALDYYRLAFAMSRQLNDKLHMDMAMTNIISVAHELNVTHNIAGDIAQYRRSRHGGLLYNYNVLLYDAVNFEEHGQDDKAIATYDRQAEMLQGNHEYLRLIYFTYVNKARVLGTQGKYNEAIDNMRFPSEIAESQNQKDLKLEVYDVLSRLYKKVGNQRLFASNREKYYQLKDTLNNFRQLGSVNELEFQQQMKSMGDEMRELNRRHAVQRAITLTVSAVTLVIILLLLVVFRQNRRLKDYNRQLYLQNVDLLKAEEEQRRLRSKANKLQPAATLQPTANSQQQTLLDNIADVMDNSDEIFQPGFSIEHLATLVGSKYKYVSQVIHEHYDCNFNTFLNKYRIQEACKRMNDNGRYGNLTIEGISMGVGFKSRSSFVTAFKRFTGLTPSEYQAQAMRQHNIKE